MESGIQKVLTFFRPRIYAEFLAPVCVVMVLSVVSPGWAQEWSELRSLHPYVGESLHIDLEDEFNPPIPVLSPDGPPGPNISGEPGDVFDAFVRVNDPGVIIVPGPSLPIVP